MYSSFTDSERDTLRAALRAHEDKLEEAIGKARRSKDQEHVAILQEDKENARRLIRRLTEPQLEQIGRDMYDRPIEIRTN